MQYEIRAVDSDNDLPELCEMLDSVMTDGMSVARFTDWIKSPRPINRHMVAVSESGEIVGWAESDRAANEPK
ncbi:MAG: hypothetical protein HOF01_07815, partial [Chloroflexi bacterium]|nr:hypothetical protein [Chloroflexota bacterium]